MAALVTVGVASPSCREPQKGAAALLAHLRDLAAAGVDHALVSPGRSWDEATFDAVAAILPEVHAIEPKRG